MSVSLLQRLFVKVTCVETLCAGSDAINCKIACDCDFSVTAELGFFDGYKLLPGFPQCLVRLIAYLLRHLYHKIKAVFKIGLRYLNDFECG